MDYSSKVFSELVQAGQLTPKPDVVPPSVPMDYDWARVRDVCSYSFFPLNADLSRRNLV